MQVFLRPGTLRRTIGSLSFVLALGFAVSPGAASAAERTWTGPDGGVWSDSANWNPAGPLVDGDEAVFPSGAPAGSVNDQINLTLQAIRFEGTHAVTGNELTVAAGVTATGAIAASLGVTQVVLMDSQAWTLDGGATLAVAAIQLDTATWTITGSGGTLSPADITGIGDLLKVGPAVVLSLANATTFAGAVTIDAGIVRVTHPQALGVADGTSANGTTVHSGGTLELVGLAAFDDEAIALDGAGVGGTLGALHVVHAAPVTIGAPIALLGAAQIKADDGGGSGQTLTIPSDIDGPGGLVIRDDTTIVIGGLANAFVGVSFQGTASGTLRLGQNFALPVAPIALPAGATLDLNDFDSSVGAISGTGTILLGAGLLIVETVAPATFAGLISGASGTLIKVGAGALTLSGANTYGGVTGVIEGTLRVAHASALGTTNGTSATGTFVGGGATLRLDGVSLAAEPLILQGDTNGAATLAITAGSAPVTIGGTIEALNAAAITTRGTGSSGDLTLTGPLTGAGTLSVAAPLTLRLAHAVNSYSGTVIVDGTTSAQAALLVLSGVLPGAVQVQQGALTFAGPAVNIGGAVTVNSGRLTLGGPSIRAAALIGGLTMTGAAQVTAWLHDPATGTPTQIGVGGSVTVAGQLEAFIGDGFTPQASAPLTIIDNDGTDPIAGTFTALPEGSAIGAPEHRLRLSYVGGSGNDLAVTRAPYAYYLSEGATSNFFETDLLIANPHPVATTAKVTLLPEAGTPLTLTYPMAAESRRTIDINEIPGYAGAAFSMVVTCDDHPLIVERTMTWDRAAYGGHTEKATEGAATTWYFAEGFEGFYSTFLLLANPDPVPNTATVQYLREFEPPLTRTYPLAPSSRYTMVAATDPELVGRAFGMIVTFDRPSVAERAMYFGSTPVWKAGHESAGVTAPSTTWFLAEGATGGGFDTFILVGNPGDQPADVTFTFLPEFGAPETIVRSVAAHARLTVNIEAEGLSIPDGPVATAITSTVPVIAERSMYWPYTYDRWTEAHNSFGVTAPGLKWGLAEGRVGGPNDYQTYILLANPGHAAATVELDFLPENPAQPIASRTVMIPPQQRLSLPVQLDTPSPGAAVRFGARIQSDQPIAVERAMYWNVNGEVWASGTNATASALP